MKIKLNINRINYIANIIINRILVEKLNIRMVSIILTVLTLTYSQFGIAQYPGGVATGLHHWVKADAYGGSLVDNSSVSSWNDLSGNSFHGTQPSGSFRAVFNENFQNFNPSILFDGSNDYYILPDNMMGLGNIPFTITSIATKNNNSTDLGILGYGNGFIGGIIHEYDSNNFEFSFDNAGAWGGVVESNNRSLGLFTQTYNDINQSKILFQLGRQVANANVGVLNLAGQNNRIGSRGLFLQHFFEGDISEIVTYNRVLTANERIRVESYLAIKYGLTLSQTSPTSYLNSSGSEVYDANGVFNNYDNHIIGLARDANSTLDQRISKSVESGSVLIIAKNRNFTQKNITGSRTQLSNNSYLMIGSNGASTSFNSTFERDANFRMDRVWAVDITGNPGAIYVAFPNSITFPDGDPFLIVSNDANFTNDDTMIRLNDDGTHYWAQVNFSDRQYFTFAANLAAPGGVKNNLYLWLKADAGVNQAEGERVVTWFDQSFHDFNASNSGSDDQTSPRVRKSTRLINFNPTIEFSSSTHGLDLGGNYIFSSNLGLSIFSASLSDSTGNSPFILDFGNFSTRGYGLAYSKGSIEAYSPTIHGGVSSSIAHSLQDIPGIQNVIFDFNSSQRLRLNGDLVDNEPIRLTRLTTSELNNASAHISTSGPVTIGRQSKNLTSLVDNFDGLIPEVIVYNDDVNSLGSSARRRIESYLAVKYGITLGQGVAQDYLASNASTQIWDKDRADAATFKNNIVIVGRDDASALGQIKSKSVNSDAILTVLAEGESNNNSNTPANYRFVHMGDLEFLSIAHNDEAITGNTWTNTDAPVGFTLLTRRWNSQEIGDVGTVQLDFDMADADFDVPAPVYGSSDYYIVYDGDNDGNLNDQTPTKLTNQGNDIWRVSNMNLARDREFTIASKGYDASDAPSSYGNAAHGVSASLYIGTIADVDLAAINTDFADGDDITGDDEDPLFFPPYEHLGGTTCVGANGSYTTLAREYCLVVNVTNNSGSDAQLVAWFDYNHDDVFNLGERSLADLGGNGAGIRVGNSSGNAADGSFSSGNIANGFSGNVVLVFTGLGDYSQFGAQSIMRLRLTSDSSSNLFSSPTPTGIASDGEVEDQFVPTGTLPVSLSEFSSKLSGNRIKFNWVSASELLNMGFQLWGYDATTKVWRRLHHRLVASRSSNSVEPQSYTRQLRLPKSIDSLSKVGLSSIDLDGTEHYYGPFELGKRYGSGVTPKSIKWENIRQQSDEQMARLGYRHGSMGYYKQGNVTSNASDSVNPEQVSDNVIEVGVSQTGLYRITGEQLVETGVDISKYTRQNIGVLDSKGDIVARRIISRGEGVGVNKTLGLAGEIVFYARAPEGEATIYTDQRVYRIVLDESMARQVQFQRRQRRNGDYQNGGYSEYYWETVILEEQEKYAVMNQADDPWIMGKMIVAKRPRTMLKTLTLPADVLTDKGYELILGLARNSALPPLDGDLDGVQDPEHVVQGVAIDKFGELKYLDSYQATGLGEWNLRFPITATVQIIDDLDQARVGAILKAGDGYTRSVTSVDNIGIRFARAYKAKGANRYLRFTAPDDGALGYQVLIPKTRRVIILASVGNHLIRIIPESLESVLDEGVSKTKVSFRAWQGQRDKVDVEYWVLIDEGYLSPNSIQSVKLKSQQQMLAHVWESQMLVISHPVFIGEDQQGQDKLAQYVNFKQSQGLNVSLVNYLDVVSSFGLGQIGPFGLKKYINEVNKKGNLKAILLVGGGSYDHLDYLGTGARTFIPGFYRPVGSNKFTSTDMPYIQDTAISLGRWPARSREEVEAIVDKSMRWSAKTHPNLLLLAEERDKKNDFKHALQTLSRENEQSFNMVHHYMDDILAENQSMERADILLMVKQGFIDKVDDGVDAIVYLGHGSVDRIMKSNVFNATDVKSLAQSPVSMWLSLACYVTYYESTHIHTMAHRLMFSGNAVNLTGPSYLSGTNENQAYASKLLSGLSMGSDIGQALGNARAKSDNFYSNWNLLGDPTLRIININ